MSTPMAGLEDLQHYYYEYDYHYYPDDSVWHGRSFHIVVSFVSISTHSIRAQIMTRADVYRLSLCFCLSLRS